MPQKHKQTPHPTHRFLLDFSSLLHPLSSVKEKRKTGGRKAKEGQVALPSPLPLRRGGQSTVRMGEGGLTSFLTPQGDPRLPRGAPPQTTAPPS